MADENQTNEVEELGVADVGQVVENTVDLWDATEDGETTVVGDTDPVSELDDRVEAAVRHVAEEAAEDATEDATAPQPEDAPVPQKRERRSKQARAARGESEPAAPSHAVVPAKVGGLAGLGVGAWIGICAASLVLGLLLGRFALGGGGSAAGSDASLAGKTAVAEDQLDATFATYSYDGVDHAISIREVIEQTGSLDASLDADGNYTIPSAEYAINVARNQILMQEAEKRGITVSDEDVASYAETALGTDDFDAIATTYGMDVEVVKQLVQDNAKLSALREDVVGGEAPAMPDAPASPEEGKESEATKDYADYIIGLAGDEWDADANGWAAEDGRYASALSSYEVSNDGATYEAAQSAYYLAYQIYTEKQTELSEAWSVFLNELMSSASIQVHTLVS